MWCQWQICLDSIAIFLLFLFHLKFKNFAFLFDIDYSFLFIERHYHYASDLSFGNVIRAVPYDNLINSIYFSERLNIDLNYIQNDNYTRMMYKINRPTDNFSRPEFVQQIGIFKNMYVTWMNTLSNGQTLYVNATDEKLDWIYIPQEDASVIGSYDEIIAFGHGGMGVFGHFFIDLLTPLMLVPDVIINRAKITIPKYYTYIPEIFEALDIRNESLIYLKEGEAVYGYIVYNLIPLPHVHMFGEPMLILAKKLKKKWNLEYYYTDNQYTISNRFRVPRKIPPETVYILYRKCKFNYPEYFWFLYEDDAPTVQKAAIVYASSKFLFAPTGSNLMGLIYMRKNSVVVDAESNVHDDVFHLIALTFKIRLISFCVPHTLHFKTALEVNLTVALRLIKVGLYAAENNKWPPHNQEYVY